MASIWDFFTPEAGQARRKWLDQKMSDLAYYIPPELQDRLGFIAEMTPTAGIDRASGYGRNLLAPNRTPMQRVGDLGGMLSETAGVAAPVAASAKGAIPVAQAIQESLLGVSAGAQDAGRAVINRLNQPGPMPTLYSNPIMRADDVPATTGIKAYHGTPHDFDRFSMDKIGTGEGAQAYGHGLYFAEAEPVARGYRDALSLDAGFSYKGREGMTREQLAEAIAAEYGGKYLDNIITPRGVADAVMDELVYGPSQRKLGPERAALREKLLSEIQRTDPGRMYEVNINANPADFLDWDKPLSEQPENVRKAILSVNAGDDPLLRELLDTSAEGMMLQGMMPDAKGSSIYRTLMERGFEDGAVGLNLPQPNPMKPADKWATEQLRKAGIPGIKYLDQGSRAAGEGSRNFVVFDENLISIVKKYGIAGAAAMLGVSQSDVAQAMEAGNVKNGLLAQQSTDADKEAILRYLGAQGLLR